DLSAIIQGLRKDEWDGRIPPHDPHGISVAYELELAYRVRRATLESLEDGEEFSSMFGYLMAGSDMISNDEHFDIVQDMAVRADRYHREVLSRMEKVPDVNP